MADKPKAVDDTYSVLQDSTTSISAAKGVLKNDLNPDGESTLKAYLATEAAHGTVKLATNGSFTYEVGAYEGEDSFEYFVVNAEGDTIYTSAELEEGVFFSYDPCSVDAVEENTTSSSVNVYPNPTNGMLNVAGQGTMHISVLNVLGQTLQETCSEGNATLDLSQYESGMYLLRIETESGIEVQKVSIRK